MTSIKKQNIVLCYPVEQRHVDQIAHAAGEDFQVINAGQANISHDIMRADIFCGHAKVEMPWDEVVKQGRLRWLQSSAAGMDHCLVPSVVESNIHVTSASGVLANQVAEHGIALITAWLRSFPRFFRAKDKKEFIRRPTRDLHGSTVGIIGFGGVGRRISQLLSAFNTTILAVDMFPVDKPAHVAELWGEGRMDDLLAMSDTVVLCLPLNMETRKLINAQKISFMKHDALLVNIARGAILDTDALIHALENRQIAGAVMDVTDPEPLPEDNPLWEYENVIITPHVAGQSFTRIDDMTRLFCENIRRWKDGDPLINYLSEKALGFPIRDGGYPLWIDLEKSIK